MLTAEISLCYGWHYYEPAFYRGLLRLKQPGRGQKKICVPRGDQFRNSSISLKLWFAHFPETSRSRPIPVIELSEIGLIGLTPEIELSEIGPIPEIELSESGPIPDIELSEIGPIPEIELQWSSRENIVHKEFSPLIEAADGHTNPSASEQSVSFRTYH